MRIFATLLAGALSLAAVTAEARDRSPQAELDRALAGRVEGAPVKCLMLSQIRSSRIIDRIGILYETSGGKLYLNRPRSGASSLDWTDILLTETHGPQLCSIDIVRLVDRSAGFQTGFVGLGDFVPYTKPGKRAG